MISWLLIGVITTRFVGKYTSSLAEMTYEGM